MKVLIIGCGLAGLATALSLSSIKKEQDDDDDDIQITIIERRTNLDSRGATFGLQLNGQHALQEIAGVKVVDELKRAGVLIPSTGGYMLPWWKVRDVLLERVQEEAKSNSSEKIQIHLGMSIDTVTEHEDGTYVVTFVKNGKDEEEELQIEADLIIGADGVHSHVRQEILSLPKATSSGAYVWRGTVDTNNTDDLKHMQEFPLSRLQKFGEGMILVYFNFHPKVEGQLAWVFTARANALPENVTIDCGTTTPIDLIQAFMDSTDGTNGDDDEEELKENCELAMLVFNNTHQPSDLTWSSEMGVVDLNNKEDIVSWGGKGRITIIGDAAHALRPASGLGGSLAFEDAALLARYIAKSNTSSAASIEEHLREFERIRLPRCKSISNDQTIRSELSYKVGFGGVPAWDPAYKEWVYGGIDSSPEPPVSEMDVLVDLLSD